MPTSPPRERALVLGLGSVAVLVGLASAGLLAWVLSGGLSPVTPRAEPWSVDIAHAVDVELPGGRGALLWIPDAPGSEGETLPSHLRLVRPDGSSVALPAIDRAASRVDLWWTEEGGGRLWLDVDGAWWMVDVPQGAASEVPRPPDGMQTRGRALGALERSDGDRVRWAERAIAP